MSLRLRLALWWGGLTAVVILVIGLFAYAAEVLTLYNDLDEELQQAASNVASHYNQHAPLEDFARILAETQAPGLTLRAYGPTGQSLVESPHTSPSPDINPAAILARPAGPAYDRVVRLAPPYGAIDGGRGAYGLVTGPLGVRWRVYVLPIERAAPPADGLVTYVMAAAPLRDLDRAVSTTRRFVPLLALAGAGIMLVAGTMLAHGLLRPVRQLTQTASSIASGREFGRRVPVDGRRDELGQMASTFNHMLDRLEEAYRIQQRFVADAAHELRTPLTAIQANLEFLQRHPTMPEERRLEALAEAGRETRRLARLVASLLALARADAGVELSRQRVELDRLLVETFKQVRSLATGQRLTIGAIEPVHVFGDPDRLKELLVILLDNALKYTPPGGEVTLELARHSRMVAVTVRDTGIGIPPDDLPHVFDRFYRADPARARDPASTGLGLAIAKWIVGEHGGSITLTSDPGQGTTVTVRLPLA
jgi:two-component system, OmpR family, sensor kinase